MTSGLILCKPAVGILAADPQLHSPWGAEVAWGLEDDIVRPWGAGTDMDEGIFKMGEVSGVALMGSG